MCKKDDSFFCKDCNDFEAYEGKEKRPDNCGRWLCNNGTCKNDLMISVIKLFSQYFENKKNRDNYECKNCEHQETCKKEWGEEYQAVIGTHHCRFSWNKFIKPI